MTTVSHLSDTVAFLAIEYLFGLFVALLLTRFQICFYPLPLLLLHDCVTV